MSFFVSFAHSHLHRGRFQWNEKLARQRRIVESENEFSVLFPSVFFCHVKSMTCYLTPMFTHSIFFSLGASIIEFMRHTQHIHKGEQIKRLFNIFFLWCVYSIFIYVSTHTRTLNTSLEVHFNMQTVYKRDEINVYIKYENTHILHTKKQRKQMRHF